MDTSKLKKFASFARTSLIDQVSTRLKTVLADQSLARRENAAAVAELEKKIKELGKERVIEMVAYTWFNRFCALRFMDANQYTTIGTVSPAEGFTQPEILTEAKQGVIDEELKVDRQYIKGLLDGSRPSHDAQGEVYQQLLIAVCNSYHKLMPFMFEKLADYTELLIPEDLLSDSSVLAETRKALTVENCADVEVIGWLYQFYISEKKDAVFAAMKKGTKITPENIPAATQLFTPHWIVRYLVENSLGRLWMLNHPDSRLIDQMEYYIQPEEPKTEYLKISSPEEIKICDPACGSGHMLTYAFDLLYAIYEEQGYQATDIPRLILTHNLYGIEIDQRAGALAAFALTMKAREKYRRFITGGKVVQPNICVLENIQIDPEDLSAYMDKVGRDLFSGALQGVVNQWEEADNFGSLIRPLVTDVSEVLDLLRERQMGEDLFLAGVHQKAIKALRQADYLSPKYHVVVANPPYMGGKGMNPSLRDWAAKHYPGSKSDLFAVFVERFLDGTVDRGFIGIMTPFTWMFLDSYRQLRDRIYDEATICTLVRPEYHAFFESAYVPICAYTLVKTPAPTWKGSFIDLSEFYGVDLQPQKTLEAIKNPEQSSWLHRASADDFRKIPGHPIAYWISSRALEMFARATPLGDFASPKQGLATGDNGRFVRWWWEPSWQDINAAAENSEEAEESGDKWFPYNKGGEFRKWYGNQSFVVNWEQNGKEIRNFTDESGKQKSRPQNTQYFFRKCLSWSKITSGGFSLRYFPPGFVFDVAGCSIFVDGDQLRKAILGVMNSPIMSDIMNSLSPTLNFEVGQVANFPIVAPLQQLPSNDLSIVDELIDLSRQDWDSSELSWGFETFGLLSTDSYLPLDHAYSLLRKSWSSLKDRVAALEEKNSQVYINAYGLEGELRSSVDSSLITLTCNPRYRYDSNKDESELEALLLADTMREFISYAVGCMLGRYSLDKPGMILANQGETANDYRRQIPEPTFAPDEDNVIPLLDGDWFEDDINERFKAFLKVTFRPEHYEENLTFLEDALYPENVTSKKRKTIRDYFLKDFYSHHIKLYKKRPIYWLFSSPKGTFNALIYMHRYRPETVSTVLHYLRDFRDKLTHHADHQQMRADSASASKSEKTQAIKDVAAIKKQLKELEDYEKTLFEVAARKIYIDLDNGVKHNYLLFGSVLRKIPGLDAKED